MIILDNLSRCAKKRKDSYRARLLSFFFLSSLSLFLCLSLPVASLHYLSFVYNKNLLSSLLNPLLMLSRPMTERERKKTHDNGHDEMTMTTTRWLHCIHFRYSERTIGQWTQTHSLSLSLCLSPSCYSSILMVGLPNGERERGNWWWNNWLQLYQNERQRTRRWGSSSFYPIPLTIVDRYDSMQDRRRMSKFCGIGRLVVCICTMMMRTTCSLMRYTIREFSKSCHLIRLFRFCLPFFHSSGKVICHDQNRWERHPTYSMGGMTIRCSYVRSTWKRKKSSNHCSGYQQHWRATRRHRRYLSFFSLLITNPFGRALSSGLSTWLSKYYPMRARIVPTAIERRRRRRPREQRNRNDFESLDQRSEATFSIMLWVDCGFASLHESDEKRKETISDDRERKGTIEKEKRERERERQGRKKIPKQRIRLGWLRSRSWKNGSSNESARQHIMWFYRSFSTGQIETKRRHMGNHQPYIPVDCAFLSVRIVCRFHHDLVCKTMCVRSRLYRYLTII